LLVHGFPLDHQMWRHQLEAFSSSHQVIAPDLRGFGQSETSPGVVTMEQFADDLAALLRKLEVEQPVTLCGLSMGGYIAWQFALRHRARLARLVQCDTRAVADKPEAAQGRLESAQKVLTEGPQMLVDTLLPKLFAPDAATRQHDMVRATRKIMLGTKPVGIAAALRGMAQRPDVSGELASFDLPVLLICGEHDAIVKAEEMEGLATALPRAKFVKVAAAGHMAPLENPPAVNAALREFLMAR
jgi:pimeloyl-ACP methyl ester carboxylesterase